MVEEMIWVVPEGESRAKEGAVEEAHGEGVADEDAAGGAVVGVLHQEVALVSGRLAARSFRGAGVEIGRRDGLEGLADGMLAGE